MKFVVKVYKMIFCPYFFLNFVMCFASILVIWTEMLTCPTQIFSLNFDRIHVLLANVDKW